MSKKELIALANTLLNQHGYDQNGSKNTDFSKKQEAFEKIMIIFNPMGNRIR